VKEYFVSRQQAMTPSVSFSRIFRIFEKFTQLAARRIFKYFDKKEDIH